MGIFPISGDKYTIDQLGIVNIGDINYSFLLYLP